MNSVLQLMGLAKRAGRLALGEDMVAEAIQNHKARLILLAADTGEATLRRTQKRAGDRVPVLQIAADKAEMGGALGRESCAVCALTDLGLASKTATALATEDRAFAPVAEELERKQAKMLRRKKEKPRKKA